MNASRIAALAILPVLGLAGCGSHSAARPADSITGGETSASGSLYSGVTAADVKAARSELDALTVKGLAPKTGYSRAQFGTAWSDATSAPLGHNGCDTRNDILNRDLTNKTWRDAHHCVVMSGTFTVEPYSGKTNVAWTKAHASTLQIDHTYPLSAAWQHGAAQWSKDLRAAFANDPTNLATSDGPLNEAKGDSTPAAWMPPNRGEWCSYATKYVETTTTYDKLAKAENSSHGLWVSQADKDMLGRALSTCHV